jgi:hypothetical protein
VTTTVKKTKFSKTIFTKDKKGLIQQQILEKKNRIFALKVEIIMFQKGCFYFSEIPKCCGSGSTTLPPYIFLPVLMQQMTLRVAYSN